MIYESVRKMTNKEQEAYDLGYLNGKGAALRGPQPDPITGLVPCGCGGKATRSYSSIGCVVFCSTCGCTTKSVFFASEAVKVWNTAMGWKGGAE